MLEKLKNNKLFSVLTPILAFIGFAVMVPFNYLAYLKWIMWEMVLLDVLSALCVFALCFWSGVTLAKKIGSRILWFAILPSLVCLFYFLGGGLSVIVTDNRYAIFFGLITSSFFVTAIFFYTLSKQTRGIRIACIASFVLVVLSGCFVIDGYLYNNNNNNNNNADLYVVQNFSIKDTLPDGKGERVKVILLNGQSNASGVAKVSCLQEKTSPEEFERYEKGYENVYVNYFVDNGNNTSYGSFVHAGLNMGCINGYFGPELGLADDLSTAFPDEKIFILKYSWGGSCLATQWFAPNENGQEGPLYTAFINFTVSCIEYLRSKNYDADISAMCWMQGESDSFGELADAYYDNQKNMVTALRNKLAPYTADGTICFVDAGISDCPYWDRYTVINQAKEKFSADNPAINKYFSTLDLSYSEEPTSSEPDLAHYDSLSALQLGRRFAKELVEYYKIK